MRRVREPELMDDPAVDHGLHRHALQALRQTNRWLQIDQRLVREIGRLMPAAREQRATLLEIGTGAGGLLALSAERLPGDWVRIGLDRSRFALSQAREQLRGIAGSALIAGDAANLPFRDRSVDVVVCSLLLHHFDPTGAVALLYEAARVCRRGVVVCDLTRGYLPWVLTWLVTHVVSRSPLFHVDGPRSVRAAYLQSEALSLAHAAGLQRAKVVRVFPFRWMMVWRRESS
jgi:ubiquinone/menaquinone biosynthesis C-methylase UbiE